MKNVHGWYHIISGPKAKTDNVNVKSGGMMTSFIIFLCKGFKAFGDSIGLVDLLVRMK